MKNISHSPSRASDVPNGSSRLRVTVVTETFAPEVNGVAMTLGKLVLGMREIGHDVQVVRPRQAHEQRSNLHQGQDDLLTRGLPIPGYPDMRFGFPSGNTLRKLWRHRRPDIVHVATEGPLGWSAVAAARQLQLPLSSSFHTNFDSYSQYYGVGVLKKLIEAYLRNLHNRTMATLVPTMALAQNLQRRGFQNVSVMARGVALAQFSPTRRSETLRLSWGASATDLVVLHVGRLAKEKNVGAVIATFSAIQSRQPSAKLVFVGDGPLRESISVACPAAIFTGILTGVELAEAYASGDMFLFPSLTETYGNVVPEAMASGLAVVSYNRAAAANLITHQKNGWLVQEGDERLFVQMAAALASDAGVLASLREQASSSVAHMAWSTVIQTFELALRGVMAQAGTLSNPAPDTFQPLPIKLPHA